MLCNEAKKRLSDIAKLIALLVYKENDCIGIILRDTLHFIKKHTIFNFLEFTSKAPSNKICESRKGT